MARKNTSDGGRRIRAPRARFALAGLAIGAPLAGADIIRSDFGIELSSVATGLVAPVLVTHAGDASGRLFIVDQTGRILIHQGGQVRATPFLDLSAAIPVLNANFDERGVLGLAFHPNYEANGRFFVRHSIPRDGVAGEPCFGTPRGCHHEVLVEFRVSPGDPNVADPVPVRELIRITKPQFNHDAGDIAFGPDGFLYMSMGDGGGANDGLADNPPSHGPGGNGQNMGTMMGKMLRIDVNSGNPYAIPPSNPFVNVAGALPEIWALGLRNPYRFCFDDGAGGDGRLWITDVGQALTEELNLGQIGANYGWVIKEGSHCFDPLNNTTYPPPTFCNHTGLTDPAAEYQRQEGGVTTGISIIGGYVYRGTQFPGLVGKYVFGDYSTSFNVADGHLFWVDTAAPAQINRVRLGRTSRNLNLYVKGMGRGEDGEVYVCTSSARGPSGTDGTIWRVVAAPCQADLDDGSGNGTPDGGVDIDDLLYYLARFGEGAASADLDDGSATGTPDQGVTIEDLLYMLAHFGAGC